MREFKSKHLTICDICKRCQGLDTNDIYICKYNKNNIEIGYNNNPKDNRYKCKYFKRAAKYVLSNFMFKNKKITVKSHNIRYESKIVYKQGKFYRINNHEE